MTTPSSFYLVLTSIVLNRKDTGYRGIYRTSPDSLAFHAENWKHIRALLHGLNEDGDSWFDSEGEARRHAILAKDLGYKTEIVRCVPAPQNEPSLRLETCEQFLGWDVGQPAGGLYSVIVDMCIRIWEGRSPDDCGTYATLGCVAEFFNARLNKHRLFDKYEEAVRFLRVDRECTERFGGEMSVEGLCPVAVILSGAP